MMETYPVAWSGAAEGVFRAVLAGSVLLALGLWWTPGEAAWAFAAALLALGIGLTIVSRPKLLAGLGFVPTAADTVLVGVIVAETGGSASPFFALYFAAALALIRPAAESRQKDGLGGVGAAAVLVGGTLVALGLSGGPGGLISPGAAFGTGLLAALCVVVLRLGLVLRAAREGAEGVSGALAAERDHARRADARAGALGPALGALPVESALGLVAEAARAASGASYAHVASLRDDLRRTTMGGDADACPSWWHPSVQRLLLWSCREGKTVRKEEEVHGLRSFVAVPVGASYDEAWGAIIVGGRSFGEREERALAELSAAVGPALERPPDAFGGVDLPSGLPNQTSLLRALRRGTPDAGTPSVLAVEVSTGPPSAREDLVRRVAERLRAGGRRTFRYAEDTLVVLVGAETEAAVAGRARALGGVVATEMGAAGGPAPRPAVGFAFAGAAETAGPVSLVQAALRALEDAKTRGGKVAAGIPAGRGGAAAGLGPDLPPVRSLARATAAHDPYLAGHAVGVSRIAERIGRAMSLPAEELEVLLVGGLLHDVGKIGISDGILRKPGPLSEEEYALVKRHPELGAEIVAEVPELSRVVPAILHHHERFDGLGYPDGLRAEEIPLAARIVAVADAFDSMVRERPYGRRLSAGSAMAEVRRNAATQFDPRVAEALSRAVGGPGGPRADLAV